MKVLSKDLTTIFGMVWWLKPDGLDAKNSVSACRKSICEEVSMKVVIQVKKKWWFLLAQGPLSKVDGSQVAVWYLWPPAHMRSGTVMEGVYTLAIN